MMENMSMCHDPAAHAGENIFVHVDPDLEDLIPRFLSNRQKDLDTILNASGRDGYETIHTLGHRMKGSGGGYGFGAVTEIGASMEKAARIGNGEKIRALTGQLARYISRVDVVYVADV